MPKILKWEDWEILFLNLTYVDNDSKMIAEILGKSKSAINKKCNELGLRKRGLDRVWVGMQSGKLTVVERLGYSEKHQDRIYKCICSCRNKTVVIRTTSQLFTNKPHACGCVKNQGKKHGVITGTFYGNCKRNAEGREIDFNLSKEFLDQLYNKQNGRCALTGLEITIDYTPSANAKFNSTASVDRIDSNKGYTEDNVQFVHKDINFMKQDYNEEYYINMCKLVAEHNKEKNDGGK